MKQCRTCGITKQLTEYPYQTKGGFRGTDVGGYRLDCKSCTAEKARRYRKIYVPKGRKQCDCAPGDEYLLSAIRHRRIDAKARCGVEPANAPYLYALWKEQKGLCAISGIPMTLVKRTPHVLSLDQKVAGKGYGEGNVQWVSWAVNRAKGDLDTAAFIAMCRAIAEGVTTIPQGSTLK